MKPITKWTIIQRKASTMWWSIGLSAFLFLTMIFYPSFKDDAAELEKTFENLSDSTLQFLGGSSDFFSPVGFMNSQVYFILLPLLFGILAISLGAKLLAKEESDTTIESILSRPISRTRLLTAKAISMELLLGIVAVASLLVIILTAKIVDLEIATTSLIAATFVCYLMALGFGYLTMAITAMGKSSGVALGIATAYAFGGYIVDSLAGTVDWLKGPSKLFSFHYYQSEAILRGTYDWKNLIFFFALIIVVFTLSWVAFRRRDLK